MTKEDIAYFLLSSIITGVIENGTASSPMADAIVVSMQCFMPQHHELRGAAWLRMDERQQFGETELALSAENYSQCR